MRRQLNSFGATAFVAVTLFCFGCASSGTASRARIVAPGGPAPESFEVRFKTTKGGFGVKVTRAWSPNAADRFYQLLTDGFFKDIAFFRVIDGFVAQGGIHGDPAVSAKWRNALFADDKVVLQANARGTLVFAAAGPNTRTTQFFINLKDNESLGSMGFAPFGKVIEGMDVVDSLFKQYGEGAPRGNGPDQKRIQMEGNAYLKREFPKLDYIISAEVWDGEALKRHQEEFSGKLKAAQEGDVGAQLAVARMYDDGEGVEKDDVESVKWVRKVAEGGHVKAQLLMAAAYLMGKGVGPDPAQAAKWMRRAAEAGNGEAQWLLGRMLLEGHGVAKDEEEATIWLRKAAEQGNSRAAEKLKFILEKAKKGD